MTKRYYVADIIGTGEADVDEFRPAVADYMSGWGWVTAPGDPMPEWALVKLTAEPPAEMAFDVRIDALPTCPTSTPVHEIDTLELAALRMTLDKRGISQDVLDQCATYGDVLAVIASHASGGSLSASVVAQDL